MSEAALEPVLSTPGTTSIDAAEPTTPLSEPTGQEISPMWADADNAVLSQDFANHLGAEVEPYANVLNQRFGNQPVSVLAKSYGEANKTISEGGKPIGYPPADAEQTAWDRWNSANGVPESPGDYDLFGGKTPENINEEAMDLFKEAFFDSKAPPALASQITQKYMEIEQRLAQQAKDAYENQLHEQQQTLQRELGIEYEDKMTGLKALVKANGGDPGDPAIFDSPSTIRFLLKISNLLGEDTIAAAKEATGSTGAWGGGGKAEAQRIMTDPTHPDHQDYVTNTDPESPVAQKVKRLLQGG